MRAKTAKSNWHTNNVKDNDDKEIGDLRLTNDDKTIFKVARRGAVEIDPTTVISSILASHVGNLQSS